MSGLLNKKESLSEGFRSLPQGATDDATARTNMDRNLKAGVCRSQPNGLSSIYRQIDDCSSTTVKDRNANLGDTIVKLQQDIGMLRATIGDSLLMGDSVFGNAGIAEITKQVKDRNQDLKNKKESLRREIEKKEAIIERTNRDFEDVKNTLPEKIPTKTLNFIEDYTLAFLVIAYLFMLTTIIYAYVITSDFKGVALMKGIVGGIIMSIFLFILLMYLS